MGLLLERKGDFEAARPHVERALALTELARVELDLEDLEAASVLAEAGIDAKTERDEVTGWLAEHDID